MRGQRTQWAATFWMKFQEDDSFSVTFEEVIEVHHGEDPYLGPYVVIPKRRDQILETKNKTMKDDVTVKEVPWIEVSNTDGTTYIIASD